MLVRGMALCHRTVEVVEIILVGVGSGFDLLFGLVGHGGGVGDVVKEVLLEYLRMSSC